ncbi:MAG: NHL repeat-containing protein [Solirubrobacterales bacterium]
MLLCAAAPASGNVSHAFSGTIGAEGSTPPNPYPLLNPTDVAIDQASHDIYVADTGNYRVEKFDSSGHFLLMFGEDVNKTTGGNVCTAESGNTCQPGTASSAAGGFEQPTSLAVDNYPGGQGDVYVGDSGDSLAQKFNSAGRLITTWGSNGQKDGSDATDLPVFGPVYGVAVGGGCATPESTLNGVCSPNGTLYVDGGHYADIWLYTQEGTYIKWDYVGLDSPIKVDSEGTIYAQAGPVFKNVPEHGEYQDTIRYQMTTEESTTGFGFDPSNQDLYQDVGSTIYRYSDCEPALNGPCSPADSFGSGELSGAQGVDVDGATHTVYVANSNDNDVAEFSDVRPSVTTGPFTNATGSSVTLTGQIDPLGRGNITSCQFEWGFDKSYGHTAPCTPDPASANFTEPTDVTTTVTGFSPGTKEHYRLVATNAVGATNKGEDRTFITTQRPAIDGLSAENLAATSAELKGQINPNGLETTYRFEYGPTTSYGQSVPVPDGTVAASNSDQPVAAHLENLVPHDVYHYRLVATNNEGTTAAPDHTFNFYPPSCPNENVRQQTQANFLPDCRAYELVSPSDAGGTQLYPGGPNTGYATNPSRFSFVGLWSTIPNSGGSPIDGSGDLYVATRTDTGWITKYVGLPSTEAAIDGGPPMGPPNSAPGPGETGGLYPNQSSDLSAPDAVQNNVLTDPGMNRFVDWNDGPENPGGDPNDIASNAPYVWNAEGRLLDRWPTNLATVPAGVKPDTGHGPEGVSPGGEHALDCPEVIETGGFHQALYNNCPGDVTASSDLSHFVFASEWNVLAPGGQLSAPGSVYDNNTNSGTVAVASKTPAGDDIPSQPTDAAGDPLQIPAVSSDGSHILMAAGGVGPCGSADCAVPPCSGTFDITIRCPMQSSNLYMRIDDAVTYDVSDGHDVNYVGMTADGSRVFFTTKQQLTSEDTDASTDLYMWSEATDSLTLISKGSGGTGNSDSCSAKFVSGCGVVPYSDASYCTLDSGEGGNCHSDSAIASETGEIYFFSPEQLDGSRGTPNQENLYVYRNGADRYVTTMTTGPFCFPSPVSGITDSACSDTPITRMEVSPDGSHMAFVTASPITQYENAGHLEMYVYDPAAETITCASCIPSGAPPTSDVGASQDGHFMTNDGRVFFTTNDALVHGDTNEGLDVYEYVDGRPQLITTGTGETRKPGGYFGNIENSPGLIGVSSDGRDAYFSTYDTLVSEDHNGLFLKIYDARAGGGFSAPAPAPGCAAADECHGAGTSPQAPLEDGSGTRLGSGGNLTREQRKRHRRPHRHHKRSAGRRSASQKRQRMVTMALRRGGPR